MGISAKIWPITDADIARCAAERSAGVRPEASYINRLFHAVRDGDHAKLWGARPLRATLERLMDAGIGLVKLDDSDPTFALDSAALRALVARGDADPIVRELVEPELPEVGGYRADSIADILARAVAAGSGVVFCVFEDW